MITIAHGSPKLVWMPIKPSAVIYMGSLVCVDLGDLDEGIQVRPIAQGVNNTTNKDVPIGIAIGHNLVNANFSSTYQCEYITDEGVTGIRTSTTDYRSPGGYWPYEGRAMVEVALIDSSTYLRAPIRNAAIGTSITELTSTTGNANGLTVTTDATDVAPVANLGTIYCRSGQNAGQYRQTDTTSTTVHAWDVEMLKTCATAGETYVTVPVRPQGLSYVTIGDGTVASFIDASATAAANYDAIHVTALDLRESGNEWVEFFFDGDTFGTTRA